MNFSNLLLQWYLQHKRDLPWRKTQSPYLIWLSEIMLQQTRVAQGLPYYLLFVDAFPSVVDLANASEEQVLKLWQGLGYYSRARNLHFTAKHVAYNLNGIFPTNYNDLLKLKGVGEYTAAAIASFAYNESVPVVDGNVFRVLSRYFDIETDIASAAAKTEFTDLAKQLIFETNNPAAFNQAIMEFGALQCVPKSPNCGVCIFNSSCLALRNKKVALLPVKLKKTKVTNRFFNYIVLRDQSNNTEIMQRVDKGIWQHLYQFPVIETDVEEEFELIKTKITTLYHHKTIESIVTYNNEAIIHKLSHQKLHINFFDVEILEKIENGLSIENLKKFPFPIVIYNFIEKYLK